MEVREMLDLSYTSFAALSSYLFLCLILSFLVFSLFTINHAWLFPPKASLQDSVVEKIENAAPGYPPVEPRADFDWSSTPPINLRPFKPVYHLTMGLETINVSNLIEMDWNYIDRMKMRRSLMKDHGETVLAADASVKPAVDEFYAWLLQTYLPTRYPSMFSLCREQNVSAESSAQDFRNVPHTHLKNNVMNELYPLKPHKSPLDTLRAIGGLIDDDCQFLLPSDDGDGYRLQGLVTLFPNGFDMSQKFGLKLRDIHGPVPHYKAKLERSMDRFFDKMEVGRFVRRVNWTVAANPGLFNPKGNHLHEGDTIPDDSLIDPSRAVLRCELQTLHRLPQTRALLFTFKTYTYPLQDIKDEGLGNDLADAIDGMREGSAPGIHRYKRAVVWGEKVKEFLRA